MDDSSLTQCEIAAQLGIAKNTVQRLSQLSDCYVSHNRVNFSAFVLMARIPLTCNLGYFFEILNSSWLWR